MRSRERPGGHILRVLSLGAGVQSTALILMSAYGELPKLDAAIFADTQGEPQYVYDHLDAVTAEVARYGIPVHKVSTGDLGAQLTDPESHFSAIPYFTLVDGRRGMGRRQCTRDFKVEPIARRVREMLGAKPPDFRRVRKMGVICEQWIGFSADEIGRVSDKYKVWYMKPRYPLIELGMDRGDCQAWLEGHGWGSTAKSACSFCPYRSNAEWRDLRDHHPADWGRALEIDAAIRKGGGGGTGSQLDGEAFLHASRVPLALAPIDVEGGGDPDGCSPYGCRSGRAAHGR